MDIHNMGTTTEFISPRWAGSGFTEDAPQELWLRLPLMFRKIALEEIELGNKVTGILENRKRGIVLVAFEKGPLTRAPDADAIRVHTRHEYGNYCYDGTTATYEHLESGCFLAFDDPEYQEPVF